MALLKCVDAVRQILGVRVAYNRRDLPELHEQSRTSGFIDAASLAQVAQMFDLGPHGVYAWSWTNVVEVTSLLLGTNHLYIAPGPSPYRSGAGLLNVVETGLLERSVLTRMPFTESNHLYARKCTRAWGTRHPAELKRYCEQVKSDDNGKRWLLWHYDRFWPEHAARSGALFDKVFLSQIASSLDIPPRELQAIRERSANGEKMSARTFRSTGEFGIVRDAFTVAAILRGLYHHYLARQQNLQVMHHPVRTLTVLSQDAIDTPCLTGIRALFSTNTQECLARIIVAAAFSEPTVSGRLARWCDNIAKIKRAQLSETLDLRSKANDDRALAQAVDAVRRCDVRVVAKWVDRVAELGTGLGLGVLTSFFVNPATSFAITMASYGISRRSDLGKQLVNLVAWREKHLRELSKAGPGSLGRTWGGLRSHTILGEEDAS